MLKKILISLSFMSSAGYASSNGFLTETEETAISHYLTSQSVPVIDLDGFAHYSQSPAFVVGETEIQGYRVLIVERNGSRAMLAGMDFINALEGWTVFAGPEEKPGSGPKAAYCDSSCLDDAASKGFWGALEGAGKGGAGGAAIGGTAGAVVGGTGGAAAGATDGYNTCQKEKAQICGDK